jgi:aryl-alcohol dehydrogenase-like predicted oxidoreductase
VLSTPGVTATVIGASSVAQLDELIDYADAPLNRADMAEIDAAYAYRPAKGHG